MTPDRACSARPPIRSSSTAAIATVVVAVGGLLATMADRI
jgi:hypothetical protein